MFIDERAMLEFQQGALMLGLGLRRIAFRREPAVGRRQGHERFVFGDGTRGRRLNRPLFVGVRFVSEMHARKAGHGALWQADKENRPGGVGSVLEGRAFRGRIVHAHRLHAVVHGQLSAVEIGDLHGEAPFFAIANGVDHPHGAVERTAEDEVGDHLLRHLHRVFVERELLFGRELTRELGVPAVVLPARVEAGLVAGAGAGGNTAEAGEEKADHGTSNGCRKNTANEAKSQGQPTVFREKHKDWSRLNHQKNFGGVIKYCRRVKKFV